MKKRSLYLIAAIIAVSLTTGCATSVGSRPPESQSAVHAANVPAEECGLLLYLTNEPASGRASREAVLQEFLEIRKGLSGTEDELAQYTSNEDFVRTLEVALTNLPAAEAKADPKSSLRVEAIDERGVNLGYFFINFDGAGYVITDLAISHVDGAPCPE